jgi:CDP-glucose 4,6-dehydratase
MEKLVKKFYKNKKVLITGVTGFKGAWLSYWLYLLGSKVSGVGFNPNKNKGLFYKLNLQKKIKLKIIDIRNFSKLKKFIKTEKPEIIFHLAAQPLILESYKDPYNTYNINCLGTLNILEITREIKSIRSLLCVTSDKCYQSNFSTIGFKESDKLGGNDPYSGSKASAEIIINTYIQSFFKYSKNIGVASARAGNVIGGGDESKNRLIPDVINSLKNNKKIILRNPNFNRPWQHVLEPLLGYLILAKNLYQSPIKFSGAWNFGTKKNTVTTVYEIVKYIKKFWGSGKIKVMKSKYYEQVNLQLNINKSLKYLKWKPKYSIKESVEVTTKWYKDVLINKKKPELVTKKNILDYMDEN